MAEMQNLLMTPELFFPDKYHIHNLIMYPQMVFCAALGLSFARTLPYMVPFYKWLKGSGLAISELRGYGQTACGFFGLVPAPNMSVRGFAFIGVVLSLSFFLLSLPMLPRVCVTPLCVIVLAVYHCYMSQLYPESGTRASVTCVVPMTVLFILFSPVNDVLDTADVDFVMENRAGAFHVWLIKGMMFWAYFAAGVSKVKSSVKTRRCWWDGATLQAYVFEALLLCKPNTNWSYGIFTPFTHELQRFVFLRRKLICAPLSVAAMAIELGAPLTALLPMCYSPVFALFGLGLHFGIAYLQNIDFLSWWGPVYAFFLLDPAAVCNASPGWYSFLNVSVASCGADPSLFGIMGSAEAAFAIAPVRAALALVVLAVWVFGSIALQFTNGLELLPLSKFAMFDAITDLFDSSTRNKIWLSEKPHAWGTLNNYVFGPYYRAPNVMPRQYDLLPYKYLQMVYGGSDPHDGIIYANFDLPDDLRHHVGQIRAACNCTSSLEVTAASEKVYQHLRAAQRIFDGLSAESKSSSNTVEKLAQSDLHTSLDSPLLGS
jgi:hypothetical protein